MIFVVEKVSLSICCLMNAICFDIIFSNIEGTKL